MTLVKHPIWISFRDKFAIGSLSENGSQRLSSELSKLVVRETHVSFKRQMKLLGEPVFHPKY